MGYDTVFIATASGAAMKRSNAARAMFATLAFAGLGLACLSANAFELRGFRGVVWGSASAQLGAASLVSSRGDVACYKRERENMLLGDSPISEVRYCFHRDRLYMVVVDSEADSAALVAEFESTYGAPHVRQPKVVTWGGKSTPARAELVSSAPGRPASVLTIYSNKYDPGTASTLAARSDL
jgi:hypothetical protein